MSLFRGNISISTINNTPGRTKMTKKCIAILLAAVISVSITTGVIPADATGSAAVNTGYSYVTYEGASVKGEAFLACGSNGRLDRIFDDKTVENIQSGTDKDLFQILIQPEITIICGRSGTIAFSLDGKNYTPGGKATDADISGLTYFEDMYYACASDGNILSSGDGISWAVSTKLAEKPIIAISATDKYCMAITADTDIYITEDGKTWQLQNFNEYYDGYYDKYEFTNLITIGVSFVILGFPAETPGYPIFMFSDSGGEIWLFRSPGLINYEAPESYFPMRINSLCAPGDDIVGACNGGRILTMPSCIKCNTLSYVKNVELRSIATGGEAIIVVGDDYYFSFSNEFIPYDMSGEGHYSDITDPNIWYNEAAYFVTEYGLMQGTGENMFSPGNALTRAMFVTIIGRLAEKRGEVTSGFKNDFKDVPDGAWYSQYVAWASDKAIVNGYSAKSFGPDDPVTREQMAALIIRFCDVYKIEPGHDTDIKFSDAGDISYWAQDPVNRVVAAGLMQGANGIFKPRASSTRAEVAQLFMNFILKYWY